MDFRVTVTDEQLAKLKELASVIGTTNLDLAVQTAFNLSSVFIGNNSSPMHSKKTYNEYEPVELDIAIFKTQLDEYLLSQVDIANFFNVSTASVSKALNGKSTNLIYKAIINTESSLLISKIWINKYQTIYNENIAARTEYEPMIMNPDTEIAELIRILSAMTYEHSKEHQIFFHSFNKIIKTNLSKIKESVDVDALSNPIYLRDISIKLHNIYFI